MAGNSHKGFFKLHVEPSVKGGFKIYTNGHGPLIKMAVMPLYDKNNQKSSSPEPRKLWGGILVYSIELKIYQVC